jgi:acetylornithine deacetylase/succinyl-diaminopimelate desuccinylase-like protein
MYGILKGKTTGLRDDALLFAQKLIQTPSESLQEEAVADLVENEMRAIGYDQVVRDKCGNVTGILFGREAAPTVLLNSHMDTVRPETPEKWSSPVYDGARNGDVLHGLGAADCKGGLAAQVYTGALLRRSLLPLRGNLIVTASVAEENGVGIGVRGLIEQTLPALKLKPDYAILGEPTSLGLYYGHDGWVEMDIRIESSSPDLLENTERTIIRDCMAVSGTNAGKQIEKMEPVLTSSDSKSCRDLRLMHRISEGSNAGIVLEQVRHDVQLAAHPSPAVNVAVTLHEERQQLHSGYVRTVRRISNAWSTDPFSRLIERARQSLSAAGCEVRPGKWMLGRLGMGTVGGVLVNEYGIPTIGYGPGNENQAHAVDEQVSCENIMQALYGTGAMVHALIGVPVCGWTTDEI